MKIHDAIDQASWWEAEYVNNHPQHGSEDDQSFEGAFTLVGPYVVYSYVSQWMIHTEIWTATGLIEAIQANFEKAQESGENPAEIWPDNRPTGIYLPVR